MNATRLQINGIVQGVGFRPYVRQLATQLNIPGSVRNSADGVRIVIPSEDSERFQKHLLADLPRLARIDSIAAGSCSDELADPFEIYASTAGDVLTGVAADATICIDCIHELNDPSDRRHAYPFVNCTNCGPRFSIVHAIPFDRSNTTMAAFELCANCQDEYDDPSDRRYHAQALACPACGPKIWFEPKADKQDPISDESNALQRAIELLNSGGILALRGIGGFHLACLACDEKAVANLRRAKSRPTKPMAIMVRDIDVAKRYAVIDAAIEVQLTSAAAPIVLSPMKQSSLASSVLSGFGKLGIMLPYSPLHHLLLASFDKPLVMTSGNHRGAPQVTSNAAARDELASIADGWLLHNRKIENRIDDSVVQMSGKSTQVLRRARGLAPEQFTLPNGFKGHPDAIAFGADSKNTFALAKQGRAILSQHMGDLNDFRTSQDVLKNVERLTELFDVQPKLVMCDMHKGYQSSRLAHTYAQTLNLPVVPIQHHHAHAASLMLEHQLDLQSKIFAIVQDGTGMGPDGTLWGAEALQVKYASAKRMGTLSTAALQGGDAAALEPWRNLVARLYLRYGAHERWPQVYQHVLAEHPVNTVSAAIKANINAPLASSTGRLFDAVATALGLAPQQQSFEGEAAMRLEQAATSYISAYGLPEPLALCCKPVDTTTGLIEVDPTPIWDALTHDIATGSAARAAASFHLGWAEVWAQVASQMAFGAPIALCGGSFQNQLLSGLVADTLERAGKCVLQHAVVPPNDGGIALGQIAVGLANSGSRER